jgi:hypothetical protein
MDLIDVGFAVFIVALVVSAGLIIYYINEKSKKVSATSMFEERRAQFKWGGLTVDYRSPLDSTQASTEGYLPLTNSMKAIERIQAAYNTPPWSDDRSTGATNLSTNATDATAIHLRKKSKARNLFRADKIRSPTSTRDMSV